MNLFEDDGFNRHMPFIFEGNKLLYCKASHEDTVLEEQGFRVLPHHQSESVTPYRAYRVCIADIDLENNTVSNEQEIDCCHKKNIYCSPSAFRDHDNKINYLYTKEDIVSSRKPIYRAYRRTGDNFNNLSGDIHVPMLMGVKNYCISETKDYMSVASSYIGNAYILVFDKNLMIVKKISLGRCGFIRRISAIAGTKKLILTYPDGNMTGSNYCHTSEILDLDTLETKRIRCDDKSVYKCSIFGDKIVYALRESTDLYRMSLKISDYNLSTGRIVAKIDNIFRYKHGNF